MKNNKMEYKRHLLKSVILKIEALPLGFGVFLLLVYYENLAFWNWGSRELVAFLVLMVFILPFLFSICSLLFYIELYDDKIILVNGVFGFWRKTYNFMQYPYCRIEYNNGHATNIIKMRKHNTSRIFPYYGIDLVDPQDLKEIISILESKGVTVVTKDLREV